MSNHMKYALVVLTLIAIIALSFGIGYNLGRAPAGGVQGLGVVEEAWNIIFRDYVDRDRLEPHLIPKKVLFIDKMPKLPNGMIDKQRLKITCQETDMVSDCPMTTGIDMILPSNQLDTTSGAN